MSNDDVFSISIGEALIQIEVAIVYPPIEDLADALYWQSKGDHAPMAAYLAKVEAVKARFPKAN